ncbi:MAG: hypothetical protein GY857_17210, partial [Desulfobacula sp.]|nr:hypothetical protein [Desulfobacula sp.]
MDSDINISKIKVSEITLKPYYVVGVVATTIGVLIVIMLNLFTPLDVIQDRIFYYNQKMSRDMLLVFFILRLILVLGISYLSVIISIGQMLKPVSNCLHILQQGIQPDIKIIQRAQKRLLNLQFIFIPVFVVMWVLISCFLGLATILEGLIDPHTAIVLSARASMVGLISSTISSQRIEAISRRQLIPFFFPDRQLSKLKGTKKITISKRITLINMLGAVTPMTILLVTLLTLQWELATSSVSAEKYGRGIIIFTLILFFYTIIFSKELNRLLSHNLVDPINDLVKALHKVR